ncbi:MAG TPA: hypothetical protein VF033_03870 [Steroidobacteraceae bacterium]
MSVVSLSRLLAVALLLAWAGGAHAEPYLAAKMGLKCSQCHANPTGGGMRNVFGNTFAQTTLAERKLGGDEDLWTGQIAKWLAVGGNARANFNYAEVPNVGDTNEFETEEARAYLEFSPVPGRLSVYLDQRVAPGNSENMEANARFWFRENAMYVKAGRMYLPFGYRLEDDNAFVRQLSGINMQAPDEGVEFGAELGNWSTQIALSNGAGGGDETDHGKQVTARTEVVQSRWRAGASVLFNDAEGGRRQGAGVFGAFNVGPVVLLGEVDFIDDEGIGDGTELMATLAEADWAFMQGHNLKVTYEWFEPSRNIDEDEQTRSSLLYEWSPIQFLQLRAGVRVYDGIPQSNTQNRRQAFLQFHGFF